MKKHGFRSTENPYGWALKFKVYPKNKLDEEEVSTIKALADAGYQMYNVTAGSQGVGKQVVGQYKSPKNYHQGIQQGKKSLAKELSGIAEKHLVIGLKPEKQGNKVSERQLEKFMNLINEDNYVTYRKISTPWP